VCVKKVSRAESCHFPTDTANFQKKIPTLWMVKISILPLHFPECGFQPQILHFLDKSFPTRQKSSDNYPTAQNLAKGRGETAILQLPATAHQSLNIIIVIITIRDLQYIAKTNHRAVC